MNLKHRINQIKYYLKRYGVLKTIKKCFIRVFKISNNNSYVNQDKYKEWIKENEPDLEEIEKLKKCQFDYNPLISIVVPMYNTNIQYFNELVDYMINQVYTNWELCLADRKYNKK